MCYLHLEILYFHSYWITDYYDNDSQNKPQTTQLAALTDLSWSALFTK